MNNFEFTTKMRRRKDCVLAGKNNLHFSLNRLLLLYLNGFN